jgi:hypothetical protein
MPQLPDVLEANGYPFWGRRGHISQLEISDPSLSFAAMNSSICLHRILVGLAALVCASANAQKLDTAKIEQIIGAKGALNTNEGVFKVTSPRNDVKVSVDGWTMPPFMGLGSWAAFTEGKMGGAMVMGDTVLFQDEVNRR